jgi:hypothetical protein
MILARIGLDIAKNVFQLHGVQCRCLCHAVIAVRHATVNGAEPGSAMPGPGHALANALQSAQEGLAAVRRLNREPPMPVEPPSSSSSRCASAQWPTIVVQG